MVEAKRNNKQAKQHFTEEQIPQKCYSQAFCMAHKGLRIIVAYFA